MRLRNIVYTLLACSFLFTSCNKEEKKVVTTDSGLIPARFTTTIESGETIKLYTLKNSNGMEICLTNLGMRIVSVMVPDKEGNYQDVVLGFDDIAPYRDMENYFGAVLGRYAGRIANGSFILSRAGYSDLIKNEGNNTLNGGHGGFHSRCFIIEQPNDRTVVGTYISKNKEGGFPGDMELKVTYTLTENNALDIQYDAFSNRSTVINITNQSYFNLSGNPANGISDHVLFVDADKYTPTDEQLIPTGKIEPVKGTSFDFTIPRTINEAYDVNLVLNNYDSIPNLAARLESPQTGIVLEIFTTEPGLGIYTANDINEVKGKNDIVYKKHAAVCLTTQHFPNSPNIPEFPSTALYMNDTFHSHSIYKFSVKK